MPGQKTPGHSSSSKLPRVKARAPCFSRLLQAVAQRAVGMLRRRRIQALGLVLVALRAEGAAAHRLLRLLGRGASGAAAAHGLRAGAATHGGRAGPTAHRRAAATAAGARAFGGL